MQTVKIVQAVTLMLIVAVAASCASTKAYTSKLFAPRTEQKPDSTGTVLRFLETGDEDMASGDWVSTDIITGRDTTAFTKTLDQFSEKFPAQSTAQTTKGSADSLKALPHSKDSLAIPVKALPGDPLVKSGPVNGVRPKKTREE